jgi:flavin-binding protein dodecin
MTDEEVRQQVERAEAFIAAFRELIAATDVDPARSCEAACRRGLARIADTVDAVDYITVCNLANLDAAINGLLLDVIEVQLKFVGKGPGYVHGCDGNS